MIVVFSLQRLKQVSVLWIMAISICSTGCHNMRPDRHELRVYQFKHTFGSLFDPHFAYQLRESKKSLDDVDVVLRELSESERNLSAIEYYSNLYITYDSKSILTVDPHTLTVFAYNRRSVLDDFEMLFGVAIDSRSRMRWPLKSYEWMDPPPSGLQYRGEGFQYAVIADDTLAITGYVGSPVKTLSIPESIDGRNVTNIWGGAFMSRATLFNVEIPEGVTHIGNRAFAWCENLLSVTIPDSVTHIGEESFLQTALSSYTFGNGIESLGDYAFGSSTPSTDSVVLPENLRKIGCCAVLGVSSVTLGRSVEHIDKWAFGDRLEEFHVCPQNPHFSSFEGVLYSKDRTVLVRYPPKRSMEAGITFPPELVAIGPYAFYWVDSLVDLDIPPGVETIGASAFAGARNLATLRIGPDVSYIGHNAFAECERLEAIYFFGNAPETDGEPFKWRKRVRMTRRELRSLVPEQRPRWPSRTVVLRSDANEELVVYRPAGAVGWPRRARARWHGVPLLSFDPCAEQPYSKNLGELEE